MSIAEGLGYLASLLVFTTFCMKTMVPLRMVAILSNVAFMLYAYFEQLYPVLILHLILLPLNIYRLAQIKQMIRRVQAAVTHDMDFSVLLPHMSRSHVSKGDVVFRKGDHANALYYIASGEVLLHELNITVGEGDIMGEVSLFTLEQRRTATAECTTDCELYTLSSAKIQELYYQNPAFGFSLLRLITERLLDNLRHRTGEEALLVDAR